MSPAEALMWRAEGDLRTRSSGALVELLDTAPDWDRFLAAHDRRPGPSRGCAIGWWNRCAGGRADLDRGHPLRPGLPRTADPACPNPGRCASCWTWPASSPPAHWTRTGRSGRRYWSKGWRAAAPATCSRSTTPVRRAGQVQLLGMAHSEDGRPRRCPPARRGRHSPTRFDRGHPAQPGRRPAARSRLRRPGWVVGAAGRALGCSAARWRTRWAPRSGRWTTASRCAGCSTRRRPSGPRCCAAAGSAIG